MSAPRFMPRLRGRGVALRFVTLIILFSITLATLITAVDLYYEYERSVAVIGQRVRQLEQSYLDGVIEDLGVMDRERLETQLHSIVRLPDIVWAELEVDGKLLMQHGDALQETGLIQEFALKRVHRGEAQMLGTLRVAASYQEARDHVLEHILIQLIINLVRILLIAAFAYFLFQRLIGRHLDRVVEYAQESALDPHGLLTLDRPEPSEEDELSKLVKAINQPRMALLEMLDQQRHRSDDFEKQTLVLRQELLARKKLQQELHLMAQLFQSSAEALLLTDAQGRIVAVNDAFSVLTGYGRDEVQGHNPSMLASGQTDAKLYSQMWGALESTGYWEGVVLDRHKDGRVIRFGVTIRALRDRDERVANYVGSYRLHAS